MRFAIWVLAGLAGVGLLYGSFIGPILALDFQGVTSPDGEVLGYALFSVLIFAWLIHQVPWSRLPGVVVRMGVWLLVLGLLILGYGFRPELADLKERFLAALMPQRGFGGGSGEWRLDKSQDGHFYLELAVNRVLVRFLVDTGASDIMLTRGDAVKAGLDPERLAYTRIYQTANGMTRGAPVLLDELRLGGLVLPRMPASVNAGAGHVSLLGMAFFKRLDSYEVKGNRMTLRWSAGEGR
nr:Aspartyl protease-like protein [uncultured bacterium]